MHICGAIYKPAVLSWTVDGGDLWLSTMKLWCFVYWEFLWWRCSKASLGVACSHLPKGVFLSEFRVLHLALVSVVSCKALFNTFGLRAGSLWGSPSQSRFPLRSSGSSNSKDVIFGGSIHELKMSGDLKDDFREICVFNCFPFFLYWGPESRVFASAIHQHYDLEVGLGSVSSVRRRVCSTQSCQRQLNSYFCPLSRSWTMKASSKWPRTWSLRCSSRRCIETFLGARSRRLVRSCLRWSVGER